MLIEHLECCLQAVNDRGALRVRQSFVVDSPELVDNADVARFRQERRIVDNPQSEMRLLTLPASS